MNAKWTTVSALGLGALVGAAGGYTKGIASVPPHEGVEAHRAFVARASMTPLFRHDSLKPEPTLVLNVDQNSVPSALYAELAEEAGQFRVLLVPIPKTAPESP